MVSKQYIGTVCWLTQDNMSMISVSLLNNIGLVVGPCLYTCSNCLLCFPIFSESCLDNFGIRLYISGIIFEHIRAELLIISGYFLMMF